MATWSQKRKLLYTTIVLIFVVVIVGIPIFFLFYKAPSCFDNKQNGQEKGVDCGGKCNRLCQTSFLSPSISWTKLEYVAPGLYNAGAYIVNQNIEGEAREVPYHIVLYDKDGMLILDQDGKVTLPPHRNTLAFLSLLNVGKSIPVKVLFEFTSLPNWYKKTDTLSFINVIEKDYREEGSASSLRVLLKNDGNILLNKIAVYAILYDKDNNAIGFSRTFVDEILPKSTVVAPFTWNINRNGKVISIEVLYVAE